MFTNRSSPLFLLLILLIAFVASAQNVPLPNSNITELVSRSTAGLSGNGSSLAPSISADGQRIAFSSCATDIVPNDTNDQCDIFLRDRTTGTTKRISLSSAGIQGNDASYSPKISADGRYIVFASQADNLVANDTNLVPDTFVHDVLNGSTERVSISSSGIEGDDFSNSVGGISADGQFVTFSSSATNLVLNDTNGKHDIFLRDRVNGTTERLTRSPLGVGGNDHSFATLISDDGRYVAFSSLASNLVTNDSNYQSDVFVYNRLTGNIELVSISTAGAQGFDSSYVQDISADGRYVIFFSWVTIFDNQNEEGVFIHDRVNGTTERVPIPTPDALRTEPRISADGQYITYVDYSPNRAFADVFVYDRVSGSRELASFSVFGDLGNGDSFEPDISADGQYIVYRSTASNLIPADTDDDDDVFVHDREGVVHKVFTPMFTVIYEFPLP